MKRPVYSVTIYYQVLNNKRRLEAVLKFLSCEKQDRLEEKITYAKITKRGVIIICPTGNDETRLNFSRDKEVNWCLPPPRIF